MVLFLSLSFFLTIATHMFNDDIPLTFRARITPPPSPLLSSFLPPSLLLRFFIVSLQALAEAIDVPHPLPSSLLGVSAIAVALIELLVLHTQGLPHRFS